MTCCQIISLKVTHMYANRITVDLVLWIPIGYWLSPLVSTEMLGP